MYAFVFCCFCCTFLRFSMFFFCFFFMRNVLAPSHPRMDGWYLNWFLLFLLALYNICYVAMPTSVVYMPEQLIEFSKALLMLGKTLQIPNKLKGACRWCKAWGKQRKKRNFKQFFPSAVMENVSYLTKRSADLICRHYSENIGNVLQFWLQEHIPD